MNPEEQLIEVEKRFGEFLDRILIQGPPTGNWTYGDARALFYDVDVIISEWQSALMACAHASSQPESRSELEDRAIALPSQYQFLVNATIGHWRRTTATSSPKTADSHVPDDASQPEPDHKSNDIRDAEYVSNDDELAIRKATVAQAARLGLQYIDLTETQIEPEALAVVAEHICRRYHLMPVKIDTLAKPNKLMVAISDLNASIAALDDIRLRTRCQITPVLATHGDIARAISRYFDQSP